MLSDCSDYVRIHRRPDEKKCQNYYVRRTGRMKEIYDKRGIRIMSFTTESIPTSARGREEKHFRRRMERDFFRFFLNLLVSIGEL